MKLLFILVALLGAAAAHLATAQYTFEQDWDYTSFERWPNLCKVGRRQSPISFANVDPSEVTTANLERLEFSPQCVFKNETTNLRIINLGFMINVTLERPDTVPGELSTCSVVDPRDRSSRYYFSNIHFHVPAEHKLRTLKPDAEMHIEFVADPAVPTKSRSLSILIMLKASSSVNSTSVRALRHILVEGRLPPIHSQTTCTLTEDLSTVSFLPSSENYLMYEGSQTYPPCTEEVLWIAMTTPVLISRLALGKLRDALDATMPNNFHRYGNMRPPQALNNRRIYRFVDSVVTKTDYTRGHLADAWDTKRNGTTTSTAPKSPRVRKSSLQMDVYMVRDDDGEENATVYADDAATPAVDNNTNPSSPALANTSRVRDAGDDSSVNVSDSVNTTTTATATAAAEDNTTRGSEDSSNSTTTTTITSTDNLTVQFSPRGSLDDNATNQYGTNSSQRDSEDSDSSLTNMTDGNNNNTNSSTVGARPLVKDPRAAVTTTSTSTASPKKATTTTKKPKRGSSAGSNPKDKKAKGGVPLPNSASGADGYADKVENKLMTAEDKVVTLIKAHPKLTLTVALLGFFSLLLLIKACCCRAPAFVVSPEELQPLNKGKRRQQYGTGELP